MNQMIQLSILIPTIPERNKMFRILFNDLWKQFIECHRLHPTLGEIEILFDEDVKFIDGGMTVGAKREGLVQRARGKYLCFIDDDEQAAPNYIETLLRLSQSGADIITFRSIFKCDTYWSLVCMREIYEENEQMNPNGITKRRPFHVCPVKTDIAKSHHFPDINNAEDWAWMEKVLEDVTSTNHTDMILHQYNHSAKLSAVDEIERQ